MTDVYKNGRSPAVVFFHFYFYFLLWWRQERSTSRSRSSRVMPGFYRSRYDAYNPKSAMKTGHHWRPTLMHLGCMIEIHHHHHHHHVVLVARISLTLSRHFFLSFIASGKSCGQHPVSSHSCWMYVRAGRPAFARPCVGVHKSTSLMSSSLLLQQCPACLE